MIYLSPTASNEVIVTLYEKCINQTNPFFCWRLVNKESNQTTLFYQDDHSKAPYYYNAFTVSISTTEGVTQGIIDISGGEYTYTVYEMNEQYSLDYENPVRVVETGILIVPVTYSQIISYTQSDDDVIVSYKNI